MGKVRDVNDLDSGNGGGRESDSAAPRFAAELITRAGLRKLPEPKPLIDNVLDQGTVALLYGRWGTCKSFIALDWAASIATARPWQNRNTERRRALYVAAEGAFGLAARVEAWETGWHTYISEGDLAVLPHPVNLTTAADIADLAALVGWGGYGFVIIDTLSRCMVGGDENSARDCGMVVDALTRLRESTPEGRGCVLGVHHAGKDGKTFRGSTVFEAGADTVYSTTADGRVITLDREKRKDGPQLDRHELRLDLVAGTESGVIGVHRDGQQTGTAERLLVVFNAHFGATGASRADLRNTAADVASIGPASFSRGLNELLGTGRLVNTGSDKSPFYQLPRHVSG